MQHKLPEEDSIRQYLLGTLREPELSAMEDRLMASEALAETAELIADEIIEHYIDGDLNKSDREAVEAHFFRPPAHREKLQFARFLRDRFGSHSVLVQDLVSHDSIKSHGLIVRYGGVALSSVLGILCVYLGVERHTAKQQLFASRSAETTLQSQLTEARERAFNLTEKLQSLQTLSTPAKFLDLQPGVSRGSSSEIPTARITRDTQFIPVDLVLPSGWSAQSRARLLDSKEREVMSQSGLRPIPSPPFSRLLFVIPAQGMESGKYTLIVTPEERLDQSETYPLNVSRPQ